MRFEFNDDSQKICNSADVVNYGIQCDICGNKFQSVSNINGRRYCAGCYYKTFMKDNQQAEIDELKQQLAEKDKEIERLKTKQELTFMHSKEYYFQRCNLLEEANIKLQFTQTQLAIQELAEVERLLYESHYREIDGKYYAEMEDIESLIDSRIKFLEGEKDVKD